MSKKNNLNITELDEIIALEILLNSYNIDAVDLGREKVKYIIYLLDLALRSTKVQ